MEADSSYISLSDVKLLQWIRVPESWLLAKFLAYDVIRTLRRASSHPYMVCTLKREGQSGSVPMSWLSERSLITDWVHVQHTKKHPVSTNNWTRSGSSRSGKEPVRLFERSHNFWTRAPLHWMPNHPFPQGSPTVQEVLFVQEAPLVLL